MSEIISYEELRKMQNAERDNKELQSLDDGFFQKVKDYIRSKEMILEQNRDKDNTFSQRSVEQCEKELENVKKILSDISGRRNRKIILQALTNIGARVHNTERMLPFEEKLYNNIIELLKVNSEEFESKFADMPAEQSAEAGGVKALQFTEPVQPFAWTDGKTYGPYSKDDVANIPSQVGEILIKERKAIALIPRSDIGVQNENA